MINCRPTKHSIDGLYDFIFYIQKFYDTKKLSIIEIGSWKGESARIFADYFKIVYCVDPWDVENAPIPMKPDVKIAESMIDKLVKEKKNIIKIKGTSAEVVKNINKFFDVVYIDALHEYDDVKADVMAWKDKSIKFIGGHDYRVNTNGVILAVNEILGKPDRTFKDWSWIKGVKC
ncbi:MAG TPA: class I SAM-dependent methyltransferase [Candidatus Lokiarchaeia archaeon]